MISIKDLKYSYKNGNEVLKEINLDISQGEFVAIVGKNASGKSTLARLISGILKPSSGSITVDNIDVTDKKGFLELRKTIGIVFQNPENQIIFNNVYDDIAFALNNLKMDNIDDRIEKALDKTGMKKYILSDTFELSLGQKQRVTIAGVLSLNPKCIVFDEPTTMIDSQGKKDIYAILENLKNQGYTIIYITNLADEILLADRVIILDDGKIISDFKKQDILENVSLLIDNNIDLPTLIRIVLLLKEKGINISLNKWTIQELTEKIAEVLK